MHRHTSDQIIEAENRFNNFLPINRLKTRPSPDLIAAAKTWSELVWAGAEQLQSMKLSAEQVARGLELAQNPVFICGVHRSGTTLLRDMLDGHPDLVVLPSEGTYYTNQEIKLHSMHKNQWLQYLAEEWLRRLANPINQPPYWLLGRSTIESSPYLDFARYLIAWWTVMAHQGNTQWPHMAVVLAYASCTGQLQAKLWVDKTPTNERFLHRIWGELPSAKIIQLIREPVATLASYKKMDPYGRLRFQLRSIKKSFAVAAQQLAVNDPKFLLIRYEDLCNKPHRITAELAAFLCIEPSDILQQPTVAGIPSQANSSFTENAKVGLILKPRSHSYDALLSRPERRLISAYLGEISARHNYPLGKISALSKLYLIIKYRLFR